MLITLFILIALLFIGYLTLRFYPAFGQKPPLHRVQSSPQYANGAFSNDLPTSMDSSFSTSLSMVRDLVKRHPNRKPETDLPRINFSSINNLPTQTSVTWFGHSACMINIEGKRILVDPMFGNAPSPFPWIGGKRYSKELPFNLKDLFPVDAVMFSHDHYDHLDYGTIQKLKDEVKEFFVPLGVAGHLERWGIHPDFITEFDWWDEIKFKGLSLACTPARHFSGRSIHDRNATLWCSWVIKGIDSKIFFSGDSGYGPHFKEIGKKYGPFDLTLVECGQYDPRWAPIHMLPEETVQAHQDVNGKLLVPIHWGAFTLSFHEWTDPVERVIKACDEHRIKIATPMIGEPVVLNENTIPSTRWWKT